MQNKYLFIVVFILFISTKAVSQEIIFGIKGGINSNNIGTLYHLGTASGGGNNVTPVEDTYYVGESGLGTQFGLFFKLNFEKFFIKSELNFAKLKSSYPLALKPSNWISNQMEVPILIGFEVFKPVSLIIGPSFNSISEMSLEGTEAPIKYNSSSMSLHFGVLLDLRFIELDVKYQYGLSAVKNQRVDIVRASYGTNVAYLEPYHSNQISLSININLINLKSLKETQKLNSGWRDHRNLY